MSKSQLSDEDKFKIMDRILDLKLSIKQAEMDKDWTLRQKLLDELEEIKNKVRDH